MENKSLYRISTDLLDLLSQIEENEGEITEEIASALTINQEQATVKMADYGLAIKALEGYAALAKEEEQRVQKIRKTYENTAQRLKEKVVEAMTLFGMEKVETPTMKLSLRKSTSTVIDDMEALPKDYKTVKVETVADKTAIKKAIQSGNEIQGAHLEESQSLQIR